MYKYARSINWLNLLVKAPVGDLITKFTVSEEGVRVSAKLRGWTNYQNGDQVQVQFKRKHFFDTETTKAIRKEG